jgi:Zn-dependent M28 family amino/carboxypeptidase
MARVFSDVETTHDLRFILFGGEEQGMIGSDRYAKELTIKDRKRIVAVVNMDMIAVDNEEKNPPAVLLEGGPVSRSQIAGLCLAAHTYTTLAVNTTLKPWNSDHVSFLKQGIAAVLTIEGYDKSNRTVHTPSDTLDHIDYDLALQIVRMNTAFVATMAGISAAGMT